MTPARSPAAIGVNGGVRGPSGSLDARPSPDAASGPTHRRARLWARIVAYVLVAGVSLGILEVGAYVYLRVFTGYDGEHLMTYQFDDYKNIQLTPGYRNTRGVFHNGQGFRRSSETPRLKPAGTYRVFLMGASTAYGLHSMSRYGQQKYSVIRNDETIDYYLERYLRERLGEPHIEVINAAIASQFSHHHLIYLNQLILKYSPDMVIFIDGFNDYYAYEPGFDQFRDYVYQERSHQMLDAPTVGAWLQYSGWWLFRKSHLAYVTGRTLQPVWLRARKIGRPRAHIDVDRALNDLRINAEANFVKMIERSALILRHEHIVPVFTLQPELVFRQAKVLSPFERIIYKELDTEWQENFVEFKNRARPIVTGYARTAATENGGLFFDLTDIFGGIEGDVYTDYCHLTPVGNRRLAEYLGEQLQPIVRAELQRLPLAASASRR